MNTPARTGRPTKLDHARAAAIVADVAAGNFQKTAALANGISYKTYKEWMRRGASGDPADGIYRSFRASVKMALAAAERDAVAKIQKAAADGQWQAVAWYLERTKPRRFGRIDRVRAEIMVRRGTLTPALARGAARAVLLQRRAAALPITYDDGGDAGGRPAET
jgi:hypothetical protein